MKRIHAGKGHIVVGCQDKNCGAKTKLKPSQNIVKPLANSKRPKIILNTELKETFDPRFLN